MGAGEAITTPLGVSLSSPPRRIKRDSRQGFYRSTRTPYRRFDVPEPGPSSAAQFLSSNRPNYFVGLRIIPQFQTSFICAQNQAPYYSDSASDSSGSDENPQIFKKIKMKVFNDEQHFKKTNSLSRDFEIFKNIKNFQPNKVRQTIFRNFALPNTSGKIFFSSSRDKKNRENVGLLDYTLPSTSTNQSNLFNPTNSKGINDQNKEINGMRNAHTKLSDGPQYTFPANHEGLHHSTSPPVVGQTNESIRLRKSKKNIPYCSTIYTQSSQKEDKHSNNSNKIKTMFETRRGKRKGGKGSIWSLLIFPPIDIYKYKQCVRACVYAIIICVHIRFYLIFIIIITIIIFNE